MDKENYKNALNTALVAIDDAITEAPMEADIEKLNHISSMINECLHDIYSDDGDEF